MRQRIVFIVHQGAFKSSPGFVVFAGLVISAAEISQNDLMNWGGKFVVGVGLGGAAKINHGLRRIAGLKRATASLNIASDLQPTATRYKDKRRQTRPNK